MYVQRKLRSIENMLGGHKHPAPLQMMLQGGRELVGKKEGLMNFCCSAKSIS